LAFKEAMGIPLGLSAQTEIELMDLRTLFVKAMECGVIQHQRAEVSYSFNKIT
jgi:hypothetical protein